MTTLSINLQIKTYCITLINNANKIRFDGNSNTIQIPREDGGTVPAFEVKDYLLGEGINEVIIEEYENLMQDDDYSLSFLKQIVKAYVIKKTSIFSEDECLIIDFLYHFSRRISIIIPEDISLNTLFQEVDI
ncbi:hypothetical protein [Sporosarcina sp. OR05]|uniref:hypothetical protein n=1 Tax=Sporosarcina sp. OR05 TaxID=2969819 RepID=UPI00352B7321